MPWWPFCSRARDHSAVGRSESAVAYIAAVRNANVPNRCAALEA